MICEFCGGEISEGALACPVCGSPAPRQAGNNEGNGQPAAQQVQPPQKAQPQRPPAQQGQPQRPPAQQPAQQQMPQAQQPAQQYPQQAQPVAPPYQQAQPANREQPQAQQPAAPAPMDQYLTDAPLAREEVDFISLAEETVGSFDERTGTWGPAPSAQSVADQNVAPNDPIKAEYVPLDNNLIGGYKGPEGGGSVAGAGEQTADDPFGLNVRETGPPVAKEWQSLRSGWRYTSWYNYIGMVLGIIVLLGGAATGVYFGFIRKPGVSKSAPVNTVKEYMTYVVGSNAEMASKLTAPGSNYKTDIDTLIGTYQKQGQGLLNLKEFKATTTSLSPTEATVNISRFVIEMTNDKGDKEKVSVLDIQQPFMLQRQIQLIFQNGQWLIKT